MILRWIYYESLKSSEIPTCASVHVVRDAVQIEPLTQARLQFFFFVARLFRPFLTKYQADKPLIVFLATDLQHLLVEILDLFIKPKVIANILLIWQDGGIPIYHYGDN